MKVSNVVSGSDGGAYIILDGNESERITGTSKNAVQNGWQRISVTKTFSSAATVTVQVRLANASGSAYFDCIQLEKGEVPSNYNLLQNGGMTLASGWSASPAYYSDAGRRAIKVDGNVGSRNYKSQTVALNVPKETTLMLSGWGKANSVPTGEDGAGRLRTFRLTADILYTDGTREEQSADFNTNITDWQYSAAAIVPKKDVTSVTVYLSYDYNGNTAYFDDVALTVEPAQTYTYDDDGNLTSTVNENGNKSLLNYVSGTSDIADFTNVIGEKYKYTYKSVGSVNTHCVETVKKYASSDSSTALQTLTYGYDAYGNVTSGTLTASGTGEKITSSSSYIENGNFVSAVTDTLGGITSYGYDSKKLLSYVQNALNNRTGYLYDSRGRTTAVFNDKDKDGAIDSGEASVSYTYTNDRLTGITTATTSYTLVYDAFGNTTQINAGDNVLATYTYRSGNGKLLSVTYGNGDTEEYTYDVLDRLVSVKYNNVTTYTVTYDAGGALARCVDSKAGITHEYEYDSIGRLIRAWQTDAATGAKTLAVQNVYDEYGRASGATYSMPGKTLEYDVSYKAGSNLVSKFGWDNSSDSAITYTYDAFERVSSKLLTSYLMPDIRTEYTYVSRTENDKTYTSSLIESETLSTWFSNDTVTYSYTYDKLGNITEIRENGVKTAVYEYDSLGQLIREDDCAADVAYVYTYDNAGNITAKYSFPNCGAPASHWLSAYPTVGEKLTTYTYSTSAWGDLLTNYNGKTITYDEIGNPLEWRNAESFTWSGSKLTDLTSDGGLRGMYFKYNADGIRTFKNHYDHRTADMYDVSYTVDGTKIISEQYTHIVTGDSYTLYYFYDVSGDVISFEYNGDMYYFQKNSRGDVLRIIDSLEEVVANYTYDAWGKLLSVTDSNGNEITDKTHVAHRNPFRYRSYYYDTETGFYYVSSRYYDPEIGRWINADIPETLTADFENFAQYNLFAYCFNNPVNMSDETGTWPSWSSLATKIAIGVGAVLIGAAVVAATAATGGAAAAFVGATVAGLKAAAISGAVGAAVGAGTSAVSHRVSTGSWKGAEKAALDGAINGFADGFMTGGITAGVGMSVGALGKTSSGIQIGKTAKPQYGKVNAGYGTPKTNGNTLISIQNNAGKRIFSLDLDSLHAVHMHLPKIFPKAHIPIGAIGSGIYAGARQW